jgi:hypothetical protein
MTRSFRGFVLLALWAACSSAAHANPLNPGSSVSGSAPNNILATYTGSFVAVSDFSTSDFIINNNPGGPTVGVFSSAVVQRPGTNTLDFVYQMNISVGSVSGFTVASYHNVKTDVFQTTDISDLTSNNLQTPFVTATVPVSLYRRSSATGDNLTVLFGGAGVTAEHGSYLVVVETNSKTFPNVVPQPIIPGFGPIPVQTFAPVPEPASLALWGTFGGAAGLIGWRRRRGVRRSVVTKS